jgi:hypothetical protein
MTPCLPSQIKLLKIKIEPEDFPCEYKLVISGVCLFSCIEYSQNGITTHHMKGLIVSLYITPVDRHRSLVQAYVEKTRQVQLRPLWSRHVQGETEASIV